MKKRPNKQIYFNKVQRRVQLIGAKVTVVVAGRRTGKSFGIAAPWTYRNMQRMPGSTGGIVVPTFKHGLTNTLPGLFSGWKSMGLIRGVHYVVGIKPPKSFKQAIVEPSEYEHVVSFYNGSRAILISQDRPGTSNSLTLDWVLVDEAKFIDFQKLKDETFPANGGIKLHFGMHSYHHSVLILTDMPSSSKGSWVLGYKDKSDPEIITAIESLICEIWDIKQRIRKLRKAKKPVPDYLKYHLRSADRRLNQLRSIAVYYKEYSSLENIDVIGAQYIKDMKRDLTPLTFATSIMCHRIGQDMGGFYNSMKPENIYHASDFEFLDSLGYNHTEAEYKALIDARADKDVDPTKPICIGMDYNANINWIVAGQCDFDTHRINVIHSFFTKFDRKIPAVVHDFCNYFRLHRNKNIIFYYDSTALGSNYAVDKHDFKWTIENCFKREGWRIRSIYLGSPMRHADKYLIINESFIAGTRPLTTYINQDNNEDLLLAIQTAGVSRGRNGFQKDKSGEKLPESEENLLERRTDGTDAFDTLVLGCLSKPVRSVSSGDVGGVM